MFLIVLRFTLHSNFSATVIIHRPLYERVSLCRISVDHFAWSQCKIIVQNHHEKSFYRMINVDLQWFCTVILARITLHFAGWSMCRITVQNHSAESQCRIIVQNHLAESPCKITVQNHCAGWSMWFYSDSAWWFCNVILRGDFGKKKSYTDDFSGLSLYRSECRIIHTSKKCYQVLHRDAFCQFPFRWIYYYGSNKSTGKETGNYTVYHTVILDYFWPKRISTF